MSSETMVSPILEFYSGAKIFITGGTGFLGKCLLEKLLRVCIDLDQIYILIREKKGKCPDERLKEIFDDKIFDKLKSERHDYKEKVTCIMGDLTSPMLGIDSDTYKLLTQEVTHVVHSAATVRFTEKLTNAIRINVWGCKSIIEFCNECSRLKVLVYVSTAFCYRQDVTVKEEFGDPPMNGYDSINLMNLPESKLDEITLSLIKPWPNTYCYTKAIAENFVKELVKDYPVVIFRPAIVMGCYKEPLPGWIDNVNGPTGILAAAGAGVLRILHADKTVIANLVPVDMVINALICSAWKTAASYENCNTYTVDRDSAEYNAIHETKKNASIKSKSEKKDSNTVIKKNIKIFNFVSSNENSITWGDFLKYNFKHGIKSLIYSYPSFGFYIALNYTFFQRFLSQLNQLINLLEERVVRRSYPSNKLLWYYTITLVKLKFLYLSLTVFLHLIPGFLFDSFLFLLGKKPVLLKGYKKIHEFANVISSFALYQRYFTDENIKDLWNELSEGDKTLFYFNMVDMDWNNYFENIVQGIRLYIFKEDETTLVAARRKIFWLWIVHRLLQVICIASFLWFLNKYTFKLDGNIKYTWLQI